MFFSGLVLVLASTFGRLELYLSLKLAKLKYRREKFFSVGQTKNNFLNIVVCGLREVDSVIGDVDAVISIMNPDSVDLAPRAIAQFELERRGNILRLEFDDIWSENYNSGLIMVSEADLTRVFSFVSDCEINVNSKSI